MLLDSHFIGAALRPYQAAPRIIVAYSGGVDSHVLLHLCTLYPLVRDNLYALHIHHGLQNQADAWLAHCAATAADLGVVFISRYVDARAQVRKSPEECARNARYQAFADVLQDGDVLLSAQHRDDQMETMLLQLFRGAGLAGLAAMPRQAPCGKGLLVRPLLDVARAALENYAVAHGLRWVEDPSNAQHDYDRNYLRHAIVPLLQRRWPGIAKTVARSARHCARAHDFIDAMAEQLFAGLFNAVEYTLDVGKMRRLDTYRQQLALRCWFRALRRRMPAETVINRIITEMILGPDGHYPELPLRGGAVRRYRDKLYWLPSNGIDAGIQLSWPPQQEVLELPGNGRLQRVLVPEPGVDPELWLHSAITVRYRQGGERLPLPGREGTQALKKLFQENGVPPWERERTPLLYFGNGLAAAGDRWISREYMSFSNKPNFRLVWSR